MSDIEDTGATDRLRLRSTESLKALAHPLRLAIIERLYVQGPMTATELGDALDTTPANCSWHLRKLAEFDVVREAQSQGGRRRPWEVVPGGMHWENTSGDAAFARASATVSEMLMQRLVSRFTEAAHEVGADPGGVWEKPHGWAQSVAYLTPQELTELNEAMTAIVVTSMEKYKDRLADPSLRPEGARLCEVVGWTTPIADPTVNTGTADQTP